MYKILVINTGSTSTKIAVFRDTKCIRKDNLTMPEDVLRACKKAVEQLPFRTKMVLEWLEKYGYRADDFDMISARGGPLPPVQGGAYRVNQLMYDVLTYAPVTRHESALACMIGMDIAKGTDVPVIIYDSVSVNELRLSAKYTGFPGLWNRGGGHMLNSRRAGKFVAEKMGKEYKDCTFVIVHLGGSISVTAHDRGKIVDTSTANTGPMAAQRAGRLYMDQLMKLCYSGEYKEDELYKLLNGKSGFVAYFGTQDARKVAALIDAGDRLAIEVTDAMCYQTCKAIGEMMMACEHPVDRLIITGGMAHFKYVTDSIVNKVKPYMQADVLPGEFEMEALAEGAAAVLKGKEEAKEYNILPAGYDTKDAFYQYVNSQKTDL